MADGNDEKSRGRRKRGAKLAWAIAHPMRRRILRTLSESGEGHSPTWLADTLLIPLGTTAYHLTVLHRLGAVEAPLEQTREVNDDKDEAPESKA